MEQTAELTTSLPPMLKEIISAVILLPLVYLLLRAQLKQTERFYSQFYQELRLLRMAIGNTTLTESQAIQLVMDKMWRASDEKMKFIKNLLYDNDIGNDARREFIKRTIESTMQALTNPAVEQLNEFETEVGKVGDLIMRNFDFPLFLHNVYEIIFRPQSHDSRDLDIERKMIDVASLMRQAHNNMAQTVRTAYKEAREKRF